MMPARIVGIGQASAGDDGVGIAVVRRLRAIGVPQGIDLAEVAEPSALIQSHLCEADPVILVDAVVDDGKAGRLVQFEAGDVRAPKATLLTSHGVGVLEAVRLARQISPGEAAKRIMIVGVTIRPPRRYGEGLSPAVAAAVERAAAAALELACAGRS
jgi:hydrogenase maturation protease